MTVPLGGRSARVVPGAYMYEPVTLATLTSMEICRWRYCATGASVVLRSSKGFTWSLNLPRCREPKRWEVVQASDDSWRDDMWRMSGVGCVSVLVN